MSQAPAASEYVYRQGDFGEAHAYLLPALGRELDRLGPARVFELGCGNGSVAAWMRERGIDVVAVDTSESGIAQARKHHPGVRFERRSAYDALAGEFGRFPCVVSLEVVEHLFEPKTFAARCFELLEPGGTLVLSTPYHGYLKNLALALSGRMDAHFTALWDGGHIKFWSIETMRRLLEGAGFQDIRFDRVGRVPVLAKSMVAVARRPAA